MENRTSDIRAAAMAMTQPVQEESQRMRDLNAPVNYRSGVIGDAIDGFSGGGNTTNNTDSSSVKITYSPTIIFQGGTPDEDTINRANRSSQDEFEKRMNEWIRKNKRINFA